MTIANRVWNPNSIPSMFSEHIEQEPHAAPAHIQLARAQRFHETFAQKLQRMARAIWHTSAQLPLSTSLRVLDAVMRDKTVGVATAFDPNHALAEPDGFCAILEDVSAVSLMNIYGRGAYIDSGVTSASCWAPAQRHVVDVENIRQTPIHPQHLLNLSVDTQFEAILTACNAVREVSNSPRLLHAYCGLFDTGVAHCVDLTDSEGCRVAGLFGITVGRIFVVQGEFYNNAQDRNQLYKFLFAQLKDRGFVLADLTPVAHSAIVWVKDMSREDYMAQVSKHLALGTIGRWHFTPAADHKFAKAA